MLQGTINWQTVTARGWKISFCKQGSDARRGKFLFSQYCWKQANVHASHNKTEAIKLLSSEEWLRKATLQAEKKRQAERCRDRARCLMSKL